MLNKYYMSWYFGSR